MAARAHTGAALLLLLALARPSHERDVYHKLSRSVETATSHIPEVELDQQFWYDEAQAAINARLAHKESVKKARNVVMFLGDGMSVPTLAAARTLLGQRRGHTGEEAHLAFEKFPTVGLAKTYCVDAQIADSACSATAYLGGVKANIATIGVSARVPHGACAAALDPAHHVHSIAEWALSDGRDAGVVTTTRVTHASPAGAYAHTAHRDWEADADVAASCAPPRQDDIALQLVHAYPGDHFKVTEKSSTSFEPQRGSSLSAPYSVDNSLRDIAATVRTTKHRASGSKLVKLLSLYSRGGRREFLPNSTVDEEGSRGKRLDGRNLIEEWQESKRAQNVSYRYVWNREQLMDAAEDLPEYLLGLFEGSHMQYHMQADPATEPTLAELTEVAIRSLSRNQNGFFLFVEGGRIDHAHHENLVQLSLDEAIELSKAVERAAQLLSEEDSLLVVTSDHAHVMTLNGYTHRGSDIIGPSDDRGDDGVPYMTLSYANGPGYRPPSAAGLREDVTQYNYHDVNFAFPASVPLDSETHGGDDVAVFARGPHHSMFTGLYEQSQLPHLMAYAACIGPGRHACQH